MIYYANIILIDMPWEEPIVLPFMKSLIFVLVVGIVSFIYIKYLIGSALYIKIKGVIWGLLFSSNLLSCLLWFSLSFGFNLSYHERILLIIAMLVSAILTIQIVFKYRKTTVT